MNIWLITIGEPVPIEKGTKDRLHRTGFLAQFLSEKGWEITWWTSAFDHFRKINYFPEDKTIHFPDGPRIILLYGGGYKSNISLARIKDQRRIAAKFSNQATTQTKPDIILCSFPPIELSLAAVKYGQKYEVPVVLDMRDMWPDIFIDHVPKPLRIAARVLAAGMFKETSDACAGVTAITGITETFVDFGLKKGNRNRSSYDRSFSLGYVSSPPDESKIKEADRYWNELGITERPAYFTVCFVGTLGRQLDLDAAIEAAKRISKAGNPIKFVLCGTGDRLDYFKQKAAGLTNVLFPGWVDAAKIHVLMRRSSVGLDPLPDRYDFLATINNKAIEYLSAGLPVISSPDKGVLADLLKEHQCGFSYPTGDADSLSNLLIKLYDDRNSLELMSKNATKLFKERFAAEKVYGEMMAYLMEISEKYKTGELTK